MCQVPWLWAYPWCSSWLVESCPDSIPIPDAGGCWFRHHQCQSVEWCPDSLAAKVNCPLGPFGYLRSPSLILLLAPLWPLPDDASHDWWEEELQKLHPHLPGVLLWFSWCWVPVWLDLQGHVVVSLPVSAKYHCLGPFQWPFGHWRRWVLVLLDLHRHVMAPLPASMDYYHLRSFWRPLGWLHLAMWSSEKYVQINRKSCWPLLQVFTPVRARVSVAPICPNYGEQHHMHRSPFTYQSCLVVVTFLMHPFFVPHHFPPLGSTGWAEAYDHWASVLHCPALSVLTPYKAFCTQNLFFF